MNIKIDATSTRSILSALEQFERYISRIERLKTELPKALAEFGKVYAQDGYDSAYHNLFIGEDPGPTNINVTVKQTENGWSIIANGAEVCFVEFGAGVYLNSEGYLGEKPPGIVGYGEWGLGLGKNEHWYFKDSKDDIHITYGTKASNVLYYTAEEMRRRIEKEARRILADD